MQLKKTQNIQPNGGINLDYSNNLVNGIVDLYLPLSVLNKTIVKNITPSLNVGSVVSSTGVNGKNITLSTATNSGVTIASDADALFPSDSATIFIIRRSLDTTNRISALFGYDGNGTGTDRVLSHAPYTDGNIYFDFGSDNASNRISAPFVKSANTDYLVFVAGGGKGREIWRNGVKIASDKSKTGIRAQTASAFRVGATSFAPSDNEEIYLFGVSREAWSDSAIKSWSINPWQIFKSKSLFIPTVIAESGLTLTIDNLLSSNTLTSTSLTQQNSTTPASLISVQTLNSPSLTQASTIATNSIVETQTLTVPLLTQVNNLVPNDTLITQSLTNAVLVQQGSLTPLGLAVNVSLTSPNLDSANNLTVANLTSAETLTTPSIISSNILSLSNLASSALLSTLNLTQQNVINPTSIVDNVTLSSSDIITAGSLIVQSLSISQTLLNIALTQQGTLAPNELSTLQALTQTSLVQANILTINGLLSSSTLGTTSLTSQLIIAIDHLATTQTLQNLLLIQQSILSLNSISSVSSLGSPSLTQQSTLIVSNTLHTQILENITLLSGIVEVNLMGQVIYMLGENSNIYVIRTDTNILINK